MSPRQYHALYYISEDNSKTGRVIGVAVGRTLEETLASCNGCKQLGTKNCYALYGTPRFALAGQHRRLKKEPDRYDLDRLLSQLEPPKVVRFGTIGDPSMIDHDELERALAEFTRRGMTVLGYTHHWRRHENAWLREWFMASCDNLDDATQALERGWRPAAIVPSRYPHRKIVIDGKRALICPAQHKPITCVECRLCAVKGAHPNTPPAILFRDHGPGTAPALEREHDKGIRRRDVQPKSATTDEHLVNRTPGTIPEALQAGERANLHVARPPSHQVRRASHPTGSARRKRSYFPRKTKQMQMREIARVTAISRCDSPYPAMMEEGPCNR